MVDSGLGCCRVCGRQWVFVGYMVDSGLGCCRVYGGQLSGLL